ncbi:class V chitinase [Cryptomeria japonica]|uniref:class V chitinase n=1 Tax=Cryptomeria japonica TaxID=3369 RepID=UPI0025AC74E8|nr:class V chitinase [Cryptomeria japonica]
MERELQVLLISLILVCPTAIAVKVGYWPAYSYSYFPPSSVDASLYTHLLYAFADLNPQTYEVTVSAANQESIALFTSTVQKSNPSVKTLLSIGGGNAKMDDFSTMAADSALRKKFIDSAISLARQYSFHGLDLDWEYPQTLADMENWGQLFTEWRSAVVEESGTSSKDPLLLTAAVYFSNQFFQWGVVREYPIDSITSNLDWVNIMTYDFVIPTQINKTGEHAALYDPNSKFSTSYGVESWLNAGLSKQKTVVGMPIYGYSWTLKSTANVGIGAEASGPGNPDVYTFAQIKDFISNKAATEVYDTTTVSAYCYSGLVWIGYDNEQSVRAKVEYAKQKGLLGYFFWNVVQDSNWALSTAASNAMGQ